jgi:hypothetical protein
MGDLYASAVGTTVLQAKDIPMRPPEFDGALALFGLVEGTDVAAIEAAFAQFGEIVRIEMGAGRTPTVVRFTRHAGALAAKEAAAHLTCVCAGVDTLYNQRSYDGREGVEGLANDKGAGW